MAIGRRGTSSRARRTRPPAVVEALEDRAPMAALAGPAPDLPLVAADLDRPALARRPAADRPAASAATAANIVYTSRGGSPVKLDLYLPRDKAPAGGWPVVLAIHGGGWRKFNKDGYGREMARALTAQGFAVVAPNYALAAPGRPTWPLNFQQLQDAVRWVRAHAPVYGLDADRVAAMGESAGGHLAALLGTYPETPGLPSARVDAVVDFYGPVDLPRLPTDSPVADIAARQFLGTRYELDPGRYREASPVAWVDPRSAPMLILQGTSDWLVPVSQSVALADALGRAGVPQQLVIVPGGIHGFRFTSGGMNLLPTVVGFLNAHLRA